MDIEAHKDLFGIRQFISRSSIKVGTVVQFTYDTEQKYAVVLNPEWEGKMHAISLKGIDAQDLQRLLKELKEQSDRNATELYGSYKVSLYTKERPYRTYLIDKISALREIYLKEPKKKE